MRRRAALFPAFLLLLSCGPGPGRDTGQARHVILFIGDGMQMENEVAASRYLYGRDEGLSWHSFPHRCHVVTWDVTSYDAYAAALGAAAFEEAGADPLVGFDPARGGSAPFPVDRGGDAAYLLFSATDSAAAATAMATGVKTEAGRVSWRRGDPAGGALQTFPERFRSATGASVGVVTTVPFNHATPAAFVAHGPDRGDYAGLASQILSVAGPEVAVGGGHPGWNAAYFTAAALEAARAEAGLVIVERTAGRDGGAALRAAADGLPGGARLLGLFGGADGAFELEGGSAGENPGLADAVVAALTVLSRDGDGLFLMAEQGDVDWANHQNDYARMIRAMAGLEAAVRAAVSYVERPDDAMDWSNTLLVVTADHATGLVRLTDAPALGAGALPAQVQDAAAAWSYPGGEVTYGSRGHTNEPVTLSAMGAGSGLVESLAGLRYPGTRLIDDTDVYRILAGAVGAEWSDP